ncbi:hypothetical protein I4U23_027523 [Adineta vaga]|nr:hypothetical protein I4U23_027523 [Adineta vaga]
MERLGTRNADTPADKTAGVSLTVTPADKCTVVRIPYEEFQKFERSSGVAWISCKKCSDWYFDENSKEWRRHAYATCRKIRDHHVHYYSNEGRIYSSDHYLYRYGFYYELDGKITLVYKHACDCR